MLRSTKPSEFGSLVQLIDRFEDITGNKMSSYIDEKGKTTCSVCRKQKTASEVSLCQGCMKFVCDKGCGAYVHKEHNWLCKKCQDGVGR